MNKLRPLLVPCLGFSFIFCASHAFSSQKTTADAPLDPILQSALMSEDELKEDLQKLNIPFHWWVHSTSAITNALGASETVTYYDDWAKIKNNLNLNGYNMIKPLDSNAHMEFSKKQLELQETLLFQNGQDVHSSCDPSSDIHCKEARTYLKSFQNGGFLDPKKQKSFSDALLKSAFSDLVSGSMTSDNFTKTVLKYPKSLSSLPGFLSQARALKNADATEAVKKTITSALLLTLDAMIPTADSKNDAYPYFDNLVPSGSLLPIERLYQKLSSKNQWPATVDLSPEDRARMGGVYNERNSGSRWIVKGFYDEGSNEIKIDLENDFYENVYTYYHELWHVAWSRSALNRDQIERVEAVLKEPDSEANRKALRDTILADISENEFRAIDQQIRLYHALGIQTNDWDGQTAISALHWHDSYIGKDAYKLLIKKKQRGGDFFFRHVDDPEMAFVGLPVFLAEFGIASTDHLKAQYQHHVFTQEFGAAYWKSQNDTHSKLFEDRYFGQTLNMTNNLSPIDINQLVDTSGDIYLPQFSCSEVARIRAVLGETWAFGFPFAHSISDPENCPDETKSAKHPGTDGSHTDVDAFPSLEGPETP